MQADQPIKTIAFGPWILAADVEKTKEYYRKNTLCDCEDCKLYCAKAAELFPKQAAFLAQFGADIARPDETCPVDLGDEVLYVMAGYTVCGRISNYIPPDPDPGDGLIDVSAHLQFNARIINGFDFPNEQEGEYFSIELDDLTIQKGTDHEAF